MRPPRAWHIACRRATHSGHARVSLDHLVSDGEQRVRDGQTERLCGLEVDGERELGRLDDRQIGRFLAPEDAAGIPRTALVAPVSILSAGGGPAAPRHRGMAADASNTTYRRVGFRGEPVATATPSIVRLLFDSYQGHGTQFQSLEKGTASEDALRGVLLGATESISRLNSSLGNFIELRTIRRAG
jgi:hypothetical protein